MTFWRDPRVLSGEWIPPRLLGREDLLDELRSLLPYPAHPHRRASVVLSGAPGVGTSTLARHFVQDVHDLWWNSARRSHMPLLLRADLSESPSPSRAVSALFGGIDPDLDPRGTSTEMLLLLLLRRLRTVQRPTVVWIDQVRVGFPGVVRLLRPLLDPDRLLPEGTQGLPPLVVAVSGETEALEGREEIAPGSLPGPTLHRRLAPLSPEEAREALECRARLAFENPPSPEALLEMRDLLLTKGWGVALGAELLRESGRRAEARGARRIEPCDVTPPRDPATPRRNARALDACILEALRAETAGSTGSGLSLPELRARVVLRCQEEGLPWPSSSQLWRHTVRLERAGAFHRDVRMGGRGGSVTRFVLPTLPSPHPPDGPPTDPAPGAPQGPVGPTLAYEARPGARAEKRSPVSRPVVPIGGRTSSPPSGVRTLGEPLRSPLEDRPAPSPPS